MTSTYLLAIGRAYWHHEPFEASGYWTIDPDLATRYERTEGLATKYRLEADLDPADFVELVDFQEINPPRFKCPRCSASNTYAGNPYPCLRCDFDGRIART